MTRQQFAFAPAPEPMAPILLPIDLNVDDGRRLTSALRLWVRR